MRSRSRYPAPGVAIVLLILALVAGGNASAAEPPEGSAAAPGAEAASPAGAGEPGTTSPAEAGETSAASAAERREAVGVASFEAVAGEGKSVPDVADHLARRLGSRGVARVVGPAELGAPAQAEPGPEEVVGWASRAGVGAVVVGRTTRLGRALSIDARVLDGTTGSALGPPVVEEAAVPEDLGRAIDAVTSQVLALLGQAGGLPDVAAPEAGRKGDGGAGAASSSGGGGISIQSDQLEAVNKAGGKRLSFTGNVRVDQNGMKVRSQRLDANYPPGRSSPDKFIAQGNVKIDEGGRIALCDRADFYQDEKKVVCVGEPAVLEQGCDIVKGEHITFHLDTEVLEVVGGADVKIREGCEDGP